MLFNSIFTRAFRRGHFISNQKRILGLSYRPIKNDKLNLLSKYEYKEELNHSSSAASTDYKTHIGSLEANYELSPKIDLFGKYALKYYEENDQDLRTHTLIDMAVSKATYKFNPVFDLTGYYRIINDRGSRLIKQGAALESGITIYKHIRLGVGWNFLDYEDKTSSDEGYSGSGPYFNISAKM
jgi:predicted porin